MPYSLKQAAEATGKTKPTILRAIQGHKISATKDEHGEWSIDPAELHRVYPPLAETDTCNGTDDEATNPHEIESLKKEIELLREMLRDRDRRADDKDEVISDLRQRLDTEGEERRRTQAQLTALLTDMREKVKAEPQPEPRRKWWQGLFG